VLVGSGQHVVEGPVAGMARCVYTERGAAVYRKEVAWQFCYDLT